MRRLRRRLRTEIAEDAGSLLRGGAPDHAVATSKTFRSLARICGAAPSSEGLFARRILPADELSGWVPKLLAMDVRRGRRAARGLAEPGPPGGGRRPGRRGGDGRLRPRRARDLPVGAARGRHPRPPRHARLGGLSTDVPLFGLSTASVYPEPTAHAFDYAERLGYDAVEVMVSIDVVSQDTDRILALRDQSGVPVCAVHAPCLLITQRVWGTDPWVKLERSAEMAARAGRRRGGRAPAVPLAARLRDRVRRGHRRAGAAYGHRLRGREHVSLAGHLPARAQGLPTRAGTPRRSPTRTPRSTCPTPPPRSPTRWPWRSGWATGCATST